MPGTVIKLPAGAYFAAGGTLNAEGSVAAPIVFTSILDDSIGGDTNGDGTTTTSGPGQWESLYIDSSTSILSHVEVRYAGNVSNPGNAFEPYRVPALQFRGAAEPSLNNVRVRFSRT